MTALQTLVVVSHVVHYRSRGRLAAYGPYAREIDIWADLFPELVIAAPCRDAEPPGDCLPFTRANITIDPQVDAGGDTWASKLRLLLALPALAVGLSRTMSRADAIHVRCPGSVGLLGVLLAPMFSRRLVAKYAGQWNGFDGESVVGRLERALLRSWWWRGPVTVYGSWPDMPNHIVPFFTSMMSRQQIDHAATVAAQKHLQVPLRVLFSGVLERRKRADALLDGVKIAVGRGLPLELVIVGDGAQRRALAERTAALGLSHLVRFIGAVPFDAALSWYEWAHVLVLPSRHSEGWPKVIAEAMSYGVRCVAVDHGQVPAMLQHGGLLLSDGSPAEIADALQTAAGDPAAFRVAAGQASQWGRRHSLEGLRDAVAALLTERWQVPVTCDRAAAEVPL
jgi:glycosyltransferase involved in cell wall biosynthesis